MLQLIIHGGAGKVKKEEEVRLGIKEALEAGWEVLKRFNALEAVIAVVQKMEDNPVFNCGTGSALNIDGEVEMDASVMTSDGSFGAVAAVKMVKNPILLARGVMDKTDHLLLVGEGAEKFARSLSFPPYDPRSAERLALLENLKKEGEIPFMPRLSHKLLQTKEEQVGTVGAVARDHEGTIAVATSTGGIMGKLPGRVGDSAIIGAGTYASKWGGISATGHGEEIMRNLLAYKAVEEMEDTQAQVVAKRIILELKEKGCSCGMIAIDWRGNVAFAFNTESMAWGYCTDQGQKIF